MEAFKALAEFATEKAWVVEAFKVFEEFYDDHIKFSQDAFHEGYRLDLDEYRLLVTARYPKSDLFGFDLQEEFKEEVAPFVEAVIGPSEVSLSPANS